ncbi:MAG: hypothetical protein NTX57_10105 [Armatimonadetes bacterium]|nr:hypothetical protein [Armatimonadota bacterium]
MEREFKLMIVNNIRIDWDSVDGIIRESGNLQAARFLIEEYGIPLMDARLSVEDYSQKDFIGCIGECLYDYLVSKLEIKTRNIDSVYIEMGSVYFPCFYIGIKTEGYADCGIAKVQGAFSRENYQQVSSVVYEMLQVDIENRTGL